MTTEIIVATLNITFGEQTVSGGAIKLEIDDREDGLNNGETSFKPGDKPGYFLFVGNNVDLEMGPVQTYGGPSSHGKGEKEVEENLTFSNADEASFGYPTNMGAPSIRWLGKSWRVQGFKLIPDTELPIIDTYTGTVTMKESKKMVGILECKYSSRGDLFRAAGDIPKSVLEIMVIATGKLKEDEE